MAPTANRAGFTIGRARLAGARPGDRERLSAALDQVSLAGIGLPSRATLILHRFAPPRPLARGGAPDGFVGSIETHLRERAAAAQRGGADGDLYFEDEDAIETALVRLALAPPGVWPAWVALLPGGGEPMARWRRAILSEPDRLSRLILRLEEMGQAMAWLTRFDPAEIASAETRLLAAHGSEPFDGAPERQGLSPARRQIRSPAVSRLAAAIRYFLPATPPRATAPAVERLILLARIAGQRPALLTASGFAQALALATMADTQRDATASSRAEEPARKVRAMRSTRKAARSDATRARRSIPDAGSFGAPVEAALRSALPAPVLPLPSIPSIASGPSDVAGIEIRFGGMFFLLNVFIALGLWGDFTRPRDALPGLSPFELIGMLGRHWHGGAFVQDPIEAAWRSMAGLGPRERPGAHFDAPVWSVPDQWLAPWPDARPMRHGPNRWHPAGFPWRDGRGNRSAAERRRRWIRALARYLDARLAAALGEGDVIVARDLVCLRPARIAIEPERIAVRFALEDHPIALRLAGLDRDPGRLAGTTAGLHFEFQA